MNNFDQFAALRIHYFIIQGKSILVPRSYQDRYIQHTALLGRLIWCFSQKRETRKCKHRVRSVKSILGIHPQTPRHLFSRIWPVHKTTLFVTTYQLSYIDFIVDGHLVTTENKNMQPIMYVNIPDFQVDQLSFLKDIQCKKLVKYYYFV